MFGIKATAAFFGKMFGTEKALTTAIDGVVNGFDKLIYTDEEKADREAKDKQAARGLIIDWLKASQGQNIARRFLAIMISIMWLLMHIGSLVLSIASVWIADQDKYLKSASVIQDYAESISGAMMLVLSFYFAAPYMGSIVEGAMAKFSKSPKGKKE